MKIWEFSQLINQDLVSCFMDFVLVKIQVKFCETFEFWEGIRNPIDTFIYAAVVKIYLKQIEYGKFLQRFS